MLAAGDRPRLQLRRLVDGAQYARAGRLVRPEIRESLRAGLKLVSVVGLLLSFGVVATAVQAVSRGPLQGRHRVLRLTSALSRLLLKVLNIRVHLEGDVQRARASLEPYLIIPNHISYLDVVVLSAHMPSAFITSREIEVTPVLGFITRAAGCAFVERRHKWAIHGDIDQLSKLLNDGYNVTLFPEGSTSPGEGLMEFKKSLLESAVRSRCRVLPVCLRYERIDGQRYDEANRDLIAWYGDMTFFPHLWKLMTTKSIDVRLAVLGDVAFREHKSRKRIARDAKARIAERFHAS